MHAQFGLIRSNVRNKKRNDLVKLKNPGKTYRDYIINGLSNIHLFVFIVKRNLIDNRTVHCFYFSLFTSLSLLKTHISLTPPSALLHKP